MVYIIELKTTQTSAIKIVVDAVNSLLTDANLDFYPYYIEESKTKDTDDTESNKDTESEIKQVQTESKKSIGGVILKEVNKTGKILIYMRLDADKFDVYKKQCAVKPCSCLHVSAKAHCKMQKTCTAQGFEMKCCRRILINKFQKCKNKNMSCKAFLLRLCTHIYNQ